MSVLLEAEENFGEGKPSRKWTFFVIEERFDQHHFLERSDVFMAEENIG